MFPMRGAALFAAIFAICLTARSADNNADSEWLPANEKLRLPFADDTPIYFLGRSQNAAAWDKLKGFWNDDTETALDPKTGQTVTRKVVRIKVPLGLNAPPVPAENPMTVAKWVVGKKLYFDTVLSSDGTVSCASCHQPDKGFTDQAKFSTGIGARLGGVSAPTVINSAYNFRQFWDGRSDSLEDQAQGPVQNPIEMTNDKEHAWPRTIGRVRAKADYNRLFEAAFGTVATRDAAAKAIAVYERTVLSGNSVVDRAEVVMRARIDEEGSGKAEANAKDYEAVLKDAVAKKDANALKALGLSGDEPGAITQAAEALARGRALFFGKARCNSCHVAENFTDNQFHNLGVDSADGKIPKGGLGRFASMPAGAKNEELIGAFKTPTLRGLLSTAPYMHNGGEQTLENVIDFYDRGGNANEYLDPKMRDFDAETKFERARRAGEKVDPNVKTFGPNQKPVITLKLNLTAPDKKDLVTYLRGLQGDPIDPLVADPRRFPNFPTRSK